MKLSKTKIDKLGEDIRSSNEVIDDNLLISLQEYRTTYNEVLSDLFTILCFHAKKVHASSIVAYRNKRIESIINKLERFPKMRFSQMADIGGCRCILRSNNDVYKLLKRLKSDERIKLKGEIKDYIQNPQKDGYKSLHLFAVLKGSDKVIEVQIRNKQDHNWATLVEITDLLYDLKLKELGNNKDLVKFHYYLSLGKNLNIEQKNEFYKILKKYNYLEQLSTVFSKNFFNVRRQWYNLKHKTKHRFFLIEVQKDSTPKIHSFSEVKEAELKYFELYKQNQSSNIVLTHLPIASYDQMSIAYSNYILTYHTLLEECYDILESIIIDLLQKSRYLGFYRMLIEYRTLQKGQVDSIINEIAEFEKLSTNSNKVDKRKENEWIRDIRKQGNLFQKRNLNLGKKFESFKPSNIVSQIIFNRIVRYVNNTTSLK